MSVTDFECAIAKSQIARYIAGENLAPEVTRQLETHISACPRCKQLLQEKKSSLEAIIEDKSSEPRTTIHVPVEPVPMTSGNLAVNLQSSARIEELMTPKPEMESAGLSLREKLREQAQTLSRAKKERDNVIELPAVTPAFAHKETAQATGVKVQMEDSPSAVKKKGFSLSTFALFKRVSDEDAPQPAMTVENLRTAKETLKTQNSGLKKPMLYLCGLCAVVAAMSFVLKDPTSLFGGKAASQDLLVKEKQTTEETPTKKLSKAPAKKLNPSSNGTNAQGFSKTPVKAKASTVVPQTIDPAEDLALEEMAEATPTKTVAPKKSVTQKNAVAPKSTGKPKPTLAHKPAKPAAKTVKKPLAKTHAKTTHKPLKRRSSVKLHKPSTAPKGNTVKLYTPENTPNNQEQN